MLLEDDDAFALGLGFGFDFCLGCGLGFGLATDADFLGRGHTHDLEDDDFFGAGLGLGFGFGLATAFLGRGHTHAFEDDDFFGAGFAFFGAGLHFELLLEAFLFTGALLSFDFPLDLPGQTHAFFFLGASLTSSSGGGPQDGSFLLPFKLAAAVVGRPRRSRVPLFFALLEAGAALVDLLFLLETAPLRCRRVAGACFRLAAVDRFRFPAELFLETLREDFRDALRVCRRGAAFLI